MNLLACLLPQTPPKSENARVIRLGINTQEPTTSEVQRKAARAYYHRNAARLKIAQQKRDREKANK